MLKVVEPGKTLANAKGKLPLKIGVWPFEAEIAIYGGRYNDCPSFAFGISVRKEDMENRRADAHIPIVDFKTPEPELTPLIATTIKTAFKKAIQGEAVWVGCMGGMGRTGLFLALMAKTAGVPDPVEYVRRHYYAHAVETPQQYAYVQQFQTPNLRWWLAFQVFKRRFLDI